MFGKAQWALATLGAGLLFGTEPAAATTITSTTFSGWKTGLTGTPTELDFSVIQAGKSYSTSTGLTLKAIGNPSIGFIFTGPDNGTYKLTGVSHNSFQSLQAGTESTATMNVTTPAAGDNALFLGLATTGNTPVTLTVSDGESFSSISTAFFGVSISHPITWLTLSTTVGSAVIVDDFYFGVSSVPQDSPTSEGATMAMCGGGLLVLLGSLRRKDKRRVM
jgi:hypothetical protein